MYLFCSATILLFLAPRLDRPSYRVFSGTSFVVLGLSGCNQILNLVFLTDEKYLHNFHSALFIFGAILYLARIPKCFSPCTFELVKSRFVHDHYT
jgi:predicted membrane channel-forming protein YqfA (hemolysin III family)